jgi:hypothetical protein
LLCKQAGCFHLFVEQPGQFLSFSLRDNFLIALVVSLYVNSVNKGVLIENELFLYELAHNGHLLTACAFLSGYAGKRICQPPTLLPEKSFFFLPFS